MAVIAEKNAWACLWAALLRTGARLTEENMPDLLPLLRARPILDAPETRKPAGDLIRLVHGRLAPDDRLHIERAVWDCAHEHTRDVLIGCLREEDVIDPIVRLRRSELGPEAPENLPPVRVTVGTEPLEADWIYRKNGVDVSAEPNRSLIAAERAVRVLLQEVAQPEPMETDQVEGWDKVQELIDLLAHAGADEFVRTMASDAVMSLANSLLRNLPNVGKTNPLTGLDIFVREALVQQDWTLTTPADEQEARFARSPSWPSPAPRVEAVATLILLARVRGQLPPEQAQSLMLLAVDRSPAVRCQVFSLVDVVHHLDPGIAWAVSDMAFQQEKNPRVLEFFLNAFYGILDRNPEWSAERLTALRERMATVPGAAEAFAQGHAACSLRLWLGCDLAKAAAEVNGWAQDPVRWAAYANAALLQLRGTLVQGDGSDPTAEECRRRCLAFFREVVNHAAETLEAATTAARPNEAAFHILLLAASEVHHGSGAFRAKGNGLSGPYTVCTTSAQRSRFIDEAGEVLRKLGSVRHPAITHEVLQTLAAFVDAAPERAFDLFTSIVLNGGKNGGYQFDSLAADLVVKTVQRYLADYRASFLASPNAQHEVMRVLSMFAEAGWQAARRLVYQLPDMLR